MLADDATFYLEFSILTLKGVCVIVYTMGIEIKFMTRSFETTQTLFYNQQGNLTTYLQISIFPLLMVVASGCLFLSKKVKWFLLWIFDHFIAIKEFFRYFFLLIYDYLYHF